MQKSPSAHHRTTLSGSYIFAKGMYRQSEKNLLNGNISSICPHDMANFGLLAAEICWRVWHPSKFQRVSRFGFVTVATSLNVSQSNFPLCSAVSWPGTLYPHFSHFLPPDGILSRAKSTLCPSTHHRTSFSGYIFATKACMDSRKKKLLNSNTSSTCPHNTVNFSPVTAGICW